VGGGGREKCFIQGRTTKSTAEKKGQKGKKRNRDSPTEVERSAPRDPQKRSQDGLGRGARKMNLTAFSHNIEYGDTTEVKRTDKRRERKEAKKFVRKLRGQATQFTLTNRKIERKRERREKREGAKEGKKRYHLKANHQRKRRKGNKGLGGGGGGLVVSRISGGSFGQERTQKK